MRCIGLKTVLTEALKEIQDLIDDYELQIKRLEWVNALIEKMCQQIKYVPKCLSYEIEGGGK